MHAYLQEIGGARMTNVNVAAEGDLLTIKVDLTAVAKDLSHQVEEWKQMAERIRTQCEQRERYLGEAIASIARLEEELQVRIVAPAPIGSRNHKDTVTRLGTDSSVRLNLRRT